MHESDPSCYLIEVGDIRPETQHSVVKQYWEPLESMLNWAKGFLCQPHDRLGRSGVVCPFVGPSLEENLFWMTVYRGTDSLEAYDEVLTRYRLWFPNLEPRQGERAAYKVILVLFPQLSAEEAPGSLEAIYRLTKSKFNSAKLASAACYPTCDKPGLRRLDFQPFRSPVPFLAFRNMVMCDIFALRDRAEFLIYLSEFQAELPLRYQPLVQELANKFEVPLPISEPG